MTEYLLRMEGVNLSAILDDTTDLSTIRGGGLAMLQSVEDVKREFFDEKQTISTGASSGLFRFKSDDGEVKRNEVARFLTTDLLYRHATFVVDVDPMNGDTDFARAREAVLARNRLRQLRMPSVAVPGSISKSEICAEDGIRPAVHGCRNKEGKAISASVAARREFGRDQKRGEFYQHWARPAAPPSDWDSYLIKLEFARDFGDIAGCRARGNLHNKLAVLYVDGNAFGEIQAEQKRTDDLKAFDTQVKAQRAAFLADLLDEARKHRSDWFNGNKLRLESLLWGGDEFMLVVPAWQGWWLLDFFFQKSAGWTFVQDGKPSIPLHHAAGLVFCHHNAHIARIKHLAKDLAELVKTALGDSKKERSGFAYLTLESFDTVGLNLERYLEDRLLGGDSATCWTLPALANGGATRFTEIWLSKFPDIRDTLPRRRVHRAAKEVAARYKFELADLLSGMDSVTQAAAQVMHEVMPEGQQVLFPLHLTLLWDYLDV